MIIANQVITIKREQGKDKYGEPTGFISYPVKARVVSEINEVPNPMGEEVVTTLTVFISRRELMKSGVNGVLYSDELSFTDEFGNNISRTPENIAPARGFSGSSPFVRVFV